jgi:hypothetical protein
MRETRRLRRFLVSAVIVGVAGATTAGATDYLGWADAFLTGSVDVRTASNGVTTWTVRHLWRPRSGEVTPETWQYVGAQGANSTGRANARERLMYRFREQYTGGCSSATAYIYRYRTTSPPSVGNACNSASTTYVGSVSKTYDTCGLNAGDTYLNHRYIPEYNFSSETASAGSTIGYRSIISVIVGTQSSSDEGCFKIYWQ